MEKEFCDSHEWIFLTHEKSPTCKDNWGIIFGNFKKIFDHWLGTWQNENDRAMNS
jgi:hypothetical protein